MEEKIETQPEEIVEEQPKTGFFDKIKFHKWRILAGVLGVLVFVGAVFGVYKLGQRQIQPGPQPTPGLVATPTPDPTANWKTYTNTEYGYSIKYPADFEFSESKLMEDFIVDFTWVKEKVGHEPGISVRVINLVGPEWRSIRDYFEKQFLSKDVGSSIQGEKGKVTILEKRKIGEVEAVRQVEESVPGAPTEAYYSINLYAYKDDRVYRLNIYATSKEQVLEKEDIFNLMLSTFGFLEEEGLKTYRDETLKFEFKYPSSWFTYRLIIPNPDRDAIVFSNEKVSQFLNLSETGVIVALRQSSGGVGATLYGGRKVVIGGKTAYRLNAEIESGVENFIWEDDVLVSDLGLSIYLVARNPSTLSKNRPLFNQILSTFRFLE